MNDIKSTYGDTKRGVDSFKETNNLGFVCFVAGSTSKFEYLKKVIPHWRDADPTLTIYTTRNDFAEDLKKIVSSTNVTVKCQDLDTETRYRLMTLYRGHLVCSQGEAFGYAAANAEVCGAFTIMNFLPTFEYLYDNPTGIAWISNNYQQSDKARYSIASTGHSIRNELNAAFDLFRKADFDEIRTIRQEFAIQRFSSTCTAFLPILKHIHSLIKDRRPIKGIFHCPPILNHIDCPPISIITPTYNRQKLIDIAFHNLLVTDYPKDKIEWVVIEDNEKTPHMAAEKIISFQIQVPEVKIK